MQFPCSGINCPMSFHSVDYIKNNFEPSKCSLIKVCPWYAPYEPKSFTSDDVLDTMIGALNIDPAKKNVLEYMSRYYVIECWNSMSNSSDSHEKPNL